MSNTPEQIARSAAAATMGRVRSIRKTVAARRNAARSHGNPWLQQRGIITTALRGFVHACRLELDNRRALPDYVERHYLWSMAELKVIDKQQQQ